MRIADAFNWTFQDVAKHVKDFKEVGFDAVQLSPIQHCKEGQDWYFLFQNYDIQTIGNRLGSESDWKEACMILRAEGLKVVTSVQLRHVAGADNGACIPHEKVPASVAKYCKGMNGTNDRIRREVTEGHWGLPRLDYENDELWQEHYIPFLDKVFQHSDYIRLDEGKHIGLPSEGYTIWDKLYDRYGKRIIAECINERPAILEEYSKYCLALTEEGPHVPRGTVRFVESHDTYLNSWGWSKHLSDVEILNRFARICKNHHNVLFYLRPFNNTAFSQRMSMILHDPSNKC